MSCFLQRDHGRACTDGQLVALAPPSSQRRALVLHAVHGEPYPKVAELLDISPQAAKSLACRGRETARWAMSTTTGEHRMSTLHLAWAAAVGAAGCGRCAPAV